MYRVSSNFSTANDLAARPVVEIAIAGLTNTYANGTYSGAAATVKKYLKKVSILGGEIDLTTFKTSPFGIDFDIINKDNTIFTELATTNIHGAKVTIKIGFDSLAISDFQTLPACYITEYEFVDDNTAIRIKARCKIYSELQRKIFRKKHSTRLTSAITSSDSTIPTAYSAYFSTNTNNARWGQLSYTLIKIDDEIILPLAYNSSAQFTSCTRAWANTVAAAHASGALVEECFFIYDSPIEFLIQILTNYNRDTFSPQDIVYDQYLTDSFGLNFDIDNDVDILDMINQMNKWENGSAGSSTWLHTWTITEEYTAWDFIQTYILPLLPGFLRYTANGKISVQCWDFYADGEGELFGTLEDDQFNISQRITEENIINRVKDGGNYSPFDWHEETNVYDDSVSKFGEKSAEILPMDRYPVAIHHEGLLKRYFKNSTQVHAVIDFDTFRKNWIYQPGDVIALTNNKLLDFQGAAVGWNAQTIMLLKQSIMIDQDQAKCAMIAINYDDHLDIGGTGGSVERARDVDSDIDDSALTLDSTDDEGTDANDAYYLVSGLTSNSGEHVIEVQLSFTIPAGAGALEWVEFTVWAGELDSGDVHSTNRYRFSGNRIYYWSNLNSQGTWPIVCRIPNDSYDIEIVKVDWYMQSASGGDVLTNVTLEQVTIFDGNSADLEKEIAFDDDSDIDDSALDYDTTNSVTTQANDAYYLVSSLTVNNGGMLVQATIEADLPANTDSDESISVAIYAGELSGSDVHATNHYVSTRIFHYNASWSGKWYQKICLYIPDNQYDIEIVKLDYYARSAGAGDQLANVKLKQVIIHRDNIKISNSAE